MLRGTAESDVHIFNDGFPNELAIGIGVVADSNCVLDGGLTIDGSCFLAGRELVIQSSDGAEARFCSFPPVSSLAFLAERVRTERV